MTEPDVLLEALQSGKCVGEEVETGRSGDLGIPDVEVALAVVLRLTDMEDFVLWKRGDMRTCSHAYRYTCRCVSATYEIRLRDGAVDGEEPGGQRDQKRSHRYCHRLLVAAQTCDRVALRVDVDNGQLCEVKWVGCRNDWRARIIPASQARASLRVC